MRNGGKKLSWSYMTLHDLGWNEAFEQAFADCQRQGWKPARLSRDHKIAYGALMIEDGEVVELEAVLCGRLYHEAENDAELPAVGDWVALDAGRDENVIRARLPRQTCFSRKAAGEAAEEQVIAANVSTVAVVTEPGPDFNLRRLERYFALIGRSGARALVILNKSDLHEADACEAAAAAVRELNPEATVCVTSVEKRKGFKGVRAFLKKGETVAFIGSSGVGKSAMINHLLGEEWLWTGEVNEVTGKGRHTTTARELLLLPRGGIVMDNPGIREVQMWTDETTLRERFTDVDAIAAGCRHHNCRHGRDAGCAIRAAVEQGSLSADRYEAYLKLDEEIAELRRRRRKRQVTLERRAKRDHKIQARNREDRRELERQRRPRARELE